MTKRYLAVGVCVLLGIVVLYWLFSTGSGNKNLLNQTPPIKPMGTENLPTTVGQATARDPSQGGGMISSVKRPILNKRNEKGQLIQVFAEKVDPKAQGVLDVVKPSARIYLKPNQVLEIIADRGTFIAPDNQPRSGEFQGKAVIRLFDGPADRPVDMSDQSLDVKMLILLDNAHFDLELGQLDSQDSVRLMTPMMDFRGKGLALAYNEIEREITRIQIQQGDFLRIARPDRTKSDAQSPAQTGQNAGGPKKPGPVKQYRIRFEKDIKIRTPEADVLADTLDIYARNQRTSEDQMLQSVSGDRSQGEPLTPTQRTAAMTAESLATMVEVLSAPSTQPATKRRPDPMVLFTPSDRDIVVNWAGLFLIEPAGVNIPIEATKADTFVRLTGADLKVETVRREAVLAGQIDYTVGVGTLAILPRKDGFVWLVSPQMGVVRTQRVDYDDKIQVASLKGPGFILTPGGPRDKELPKVILDAFAATSNGADRADDGLPPGMQVTWGTRMDLTFVEARSVPAATAAVTGNTNAGVAVNTAPQSAPGLPVMSEAMSGNKNLRLADLTLLGGVEVDHAEFSMKTDKVSLTFDQRFSKGNSLELRMITAEGNVRLSAISDNEQVKLNSTRLLLELAKDERDRLAPVKMIAQGNVIASQAGSTVDAGRLEVGFEAGLPARPRRTGAGADKTALFANDVPPIKLVTMEQNVKIKVKAKATGVASAAGSAAGSATSTNEDVEIFGDKVDVQVMTNRVHVTAKPEKPARIVRADGTISGVDLTMWDEEGLKFLIAKGPGEMKYAIIDRAKPRPSRNQKTDEVTVQWTGAMDYNEKTATALITDKVFIKADLEKEVTQIKSRQLKIDLRPRNAGAETATSTSTAAARPNSTGPVAGQGTASDPASALALQEFRFAHAKGDVEMQAYKKPGPDGKVPSRLTIVGDDVLFDSADQTITVEGPGKMLIEDREEAAKSATKAKGNASDFERALRLSAGGETIFKWKKRMLLDAKVNSLTMYEAVQMLHVPTGGGDAIQLDCNKMVAKLVKTGEGLDGWMKARGQRPDIDSIEADGDVQIRMKEQKMLTDKFVYSGAKREMSLVAGNGRMTQIFNVDNPNGLTANAVRFDLINSRLTVIEPGAARFNE